MRIIVLGSLARSLIHFRGPLLKTLVAKGHEVIGCAPMAPPAIQAELAAIGVQYEPIPISRTGINPFADSQTLGAVIGLFKRRQPDRVLAYTAKPVIYAGLAAPRAGKPHVFAMITGLGYGFGRTTFRQRLVGSAMRFLYRQALKGARGVFFQNPDDKALFKELGLLPSHLAVTQINGTGVDLDWYSPQPLPQTHSFLLAARLLIEKGIREYVQAARQLKRRYPQAVFRIAGSFENTSVGIRPAELKRWESEGVIEYLGRLEDVRPAYEQTRVYVLPSFYREGTPRTVLEAMAMGRPIITTDAPGCRETVVHGKNGLLVPVRCASSLEQAMARFIQEPLLAERMGAESLIRARSKYDVHQVNRVIMQAMGTGSFKYSFPGKPP